MRKIAEYDGYEINIYKGKATTEMKFRAERNALRRKLRLKKIYEERRMAMLIDELALRYTGFDFEETMRELQRWQNELSTDPDDEIAYTVLEGVKDLILDNCVFE